MEAGSRLLRKFEREARNLRAREDWGEKAIEANTRVIELDPRNTAALNRRAKCYWKQQNLSAAKVDYLRALELDPKNANIQNALREIEEEAQKQNADKEFIKDIRAIKSFDKAFAIAKSHKSKSPSKRLIAIEAFKQAFLLDKKRTDVLIELAAVHRTLRQRDEAEKIYEWILRRNKNSSVAKVGLAAIYKDKKRLRDGLKLCDEVLAQEPWNSHALRCQAGILSELDRGVEAAESFERSFRSRKHGRGS